jgi:uncharacterized protein (UPF0335 family)
MGRKKSNNDEAVRMPTELSEIKAIVDEFMNRYDTLENEIQLLAEDQKNLLEEFGDRLDMKSMRQAMRTVKIRKKVAHKDTYETFVDILDGRESV